MVKDSRGEPTDLVPVIAEVSAFREAARRLVKSDLSLGEKCHRLVRLGDRTRETALPEICRRAIWEECRELLGIPAPVMTVPSDQVERAAVSLRAKGYGACPTCRRGLYGEVDFQRWRALRAGYVVESAAREGAVR